MSAVEKVIRKAEQDRIRGHDDRALTRLKEALAAQPQEFLLARETASLCFELHRVAEGVTTLRGALRRCPNERGEILLLAQEEFQRVHSIEVAEFLFDLYLSEPDLDKARETLRPLVPGDLEKLLAKLRAKVESLHQDVPAGESRHDARIGGIWLAEAIVLAALGRWEEMATTCDRILDRDPRLTEALGHLCKTEMQANPQCLDLRFVLGRCYVTVGDFERAAEQFKATAAEPRLRARAAHFLAGVPHSPLLLPVRAHLLLLDSQFDAANELLEEFCNSNTGAPAAVRALLESVPGATHATERLRQLYARVLAGTSAVERAVREIEETRRTGVDPAANLQVVDEILEQRPRDAEALLLRARLSLDLDKADAAATYFRRALDADATRTEALRAEIEAAYARTSQNGAMGQLLVSVLTDLEAPGEAVATLQQLRDRKLLPAAAGYALALGIASRYGLSADLLALFVEAAVEHGHADEARAAVAYYHTAPGTRVQEFAQRMATLLQERPELADGCARALVDVQSTPALRLALLQASLATGDPETTLRELGVLVAEVPELGNAVLALLESFVATRGEVPRALELAAELHLDAGRPQEAADFLARALRAEPAAADRICRRADRLFNHSPAEDGVWRPIVLALLDAGRPRHVRDLCYRAAQSLPAARQGFLHFALGCIQLDNGQASAAANAFQSALQCADAPLDRLIAALRRAADTDAQLGHARYVLARALLLGGGQVDEAVALLAEAVRLDQMLADLVLDALQDHANEVEMHGAALLLAGTLCLRRGEQARGVALLDQTLRANPELGNQALLALQVEWDRDAEKPDTGLALAHALLACNQERRACRLLAELAQRFPNLRPQLIGEVESLLQRAPFPEAHRVLWDLLLASGARDAALQRVRDALGADGVTADTRLELLESALQRFPGELWIACDLAVLEIRSGHADRGESRLRAILERDSEARETVLAALRDSGATSTTEALALLEIDTLLAATRWRAAHAALHHFRASFPDASAVAMERLRLLVGYGDTGGDADLDLAVSLRDQGELEEAIAILHKAMARAEAPAATADGPAVPDGDSDTANAPGAVMPAPDAGAASPGAPTTARLQEIRLLLASLYVDMGRVDEGKEILSPVLQAGDGNPEAYATLERLSTQGLRAQMEQLRAASARTPSNFRTRLELARVSLLARDFAAAREALSFPADGAAMEATRRYLLARSYADAEQPHLAAAVTRDIDVATITDPELRRNVLHLRARCSEQLGRFGEAHVLYLRILGEFPDFKAAQERARVTYQMHLDSSLESRALVLEKRTHLDPP